MFGMHMPKKLSKGSIVLLALSAAITGFTSLKTIDLLKFTMSADQESFAWFGWACFELGLIAWIYWHGAGARRDQRGIAEIMIGVDLLAVVVAFVADTVLVQARKGGIQIDTGTLTWSIIIAVCIVAVANLVGTVATKLYDPELRKRIKQEEYQEALDEAEEEANHQIELARLKHITKNAAAIAPHIGFQQGADWTQQMYQQWALPGQQQPPALPAPTQHNQQSVMSSDTRSTQQDLQDWRSTWMRSTDQQSGVPFLSWLEEMGTDYVKDATMALARRLYPVKASQQPTNPLQQPVLDTTNGNGHSPK